MDPEPVASPDLLDELVRCAARAPSVHNTQPWTFRARPGAVELWADPTRQLPVADAGGRELVISGGAALYTLRLAARHHTLGARLELAPDPATRAPLGVVHLAPGPAVTPEEERLYQAVPRRHTHRGPFATRAIDGRLRSALEAAAATEGARLTFVESPGALRRLGELTAAAERAQEHNSAWLAELTAWTPPPWSPRRDGVPPAAYPIDAPVSAEGLVPRRFDLGRGWGRESPTPGERATVGLLTTAADRPGDWLRAGLALQHVLLRAAVDWAFAALYSQPLELAGLRELMRWESADGAYPQMLLRLGYAGYAPTTPRRTVWELMAGEPGSPGLPGATAGSPPGAGSAA